MSRWMEEKMVELIKGGGCFVSTKVGMYRANKTMTAEELGIGTLPKKHFRNGSMSLLPDDICPEMKAIRQVENRVNSLINIRTFEFEGLGHYLKNENSATFAAELQELREEFETLMESFIENYDDYITASVEYWSKYAGELNVDSDVFAKAVREAFIAKSKVREKFKFKCAYVEVPSPAQDAWKNSNQEYVAMSQEFLTLTMGQLRHEACTAMEEIAESITNDKWNQKTINRIPKLLERIESMQLVEDDELSNAIESFKESFITMKATEYKQEDNEAALKDLKSGLSDAVSQLQELAGADMVEAVENKLSGSGRRIKTPFDQQDSE